MADSKGIGVAEQEVVERPELVAARAKAEAENKTRTGKGTRLKVGLTRGKGSQVISFENFDESQPNTLPTSMDEFVALTKTADEKALVSILIDGYNQQSYTNASDPIAEFVNPTWSDDIQKNFRIAVRNYAAMTKVSIEDAVALIKPGVEKSLAKA